MKIFLKKKTLAVIGVIILIAALSIGLSFFGKSKIEVVNNSQVKPSPPTGQAGSTTSKSPKQHQKGSLTGLECAGGNARPFAVMLSSDTEARPLSGIGDADIVFEMPVVENGFTRMMAVYQCNQPKELGSVRSSRLDFVPLALGLHAIYAHFGGERTVLEELNNGIIDNIDGLKYDGTIYYRKKYIPRPHNAFTSFASLEKASLELGYGLDGSEIGYPHETKSISLGQDSPLPIYEGKFQVVWKYNKETNSYLRWRGSKSELDKNSGKQVQTQNVVLIKTTWSPINKDYIRVKTVGSGQAVIYKDGQIVSGFWEKKGEKEKLYFYDSNRKEIKFAPGKIWVEIIT